MSDFEKSLDYLYGLQKFGVKFGLNCTESLLARVGNPHRKLRSIHIAGTNGKGSTAAILSRILLKHGLKVGLYTSPHLVRFTERFRINDEEVRAEKILEVFEKIRSILDESEPPTFFEMVTAMAFLYFAEQEVDLGIIETGMGGRLDATNVIAPEVCVITNIGLDHQEYLGATLSSIAREKAGIIKQGAPLVTGALQPVAQSIMKTVCMNKSAPLYRFKSDFRVRQNWKGGFQYRGMGMNLPSLALNLRGHHQLGNAALALATLEVLEGKQLIVLRQDIIRDAMQDVRWPARLEVLQTNPIILLDGAHNPPGAESLREALMDDFPQKKIHLVIGVMADKDIVGILRRLLPLAETAIFTKPQYARAASPEDIRRMARPYIQKCYVIAEPAAAIQEAKNLAGPDDLICITGSLYFAGEVKQLFGEPAL
ncbi:MAG: bifunctional folylpolyglutamate synthase/dihydrofolate synthase [Syntrophobacteraceae bacterium]